MSSRIEPTRRSCPGCGDPAHLVEQAFAALGEAARRTGHASLADALADDVRNGGQAFADLFTCAPAPGGAENTEPGDVIVAVPLFDDGEARIEVVPLSGEWAPPVESVEDERLVVLRLSASAANCVGKCGEAHSDVEKGSAELVVNPGGAGREAAEARPVTRRMLSLLPLPAPAPCRAPGGSTIFDRPRSPPRTRKPFSGSAYTRWVQRSINQALGTRLAVDGQLGPRTRRAITRFQRHAGLKVDGRLGPRTEGALRRFTGTEPPPGADDALGAVAVATIAGVALQFVTTGLSVIGKIAAGDVNLIGPTQPIRVRARNVPRHFSLVQKTQTVEIIRYVESALIGIEQANVRFECTVSYDGLNMDVSFGFAPGGRRSRLGRNTAIRFRQGHSGLERSPITWQRCGVPDYTVVRIPIEFEVRRPIVATNYNETFTLVLSTMYGFGASVENRPHITNRRVAWN